MRRLGAAHREMRSSTLRPAPVIHLLVCRRTEQRLGDAPIMHTVAPPALLAAHPVLPTAVPCHSPLRSDAAPGTGLHCSAAQCPSPPSRPAHYATGLCHRIPLRGIQGGVSAGTAPPCPAAERKCSSKCKSGEQSLPYATRRRRICQRFGVTLVRTVHPPAVTPRRTAGAQCPTAGARHHRWYRHGVDRPQPGQ
ncbi:hypothetical protein B0H14DRAFT_3149431 [Mycena olivaceomarginata]|nr:hypothetical protein B0H14DRAFT_3149431 [Mycena olivaceomarginata]